MGSLELFSSLQKYHVCALPVSNMQNLEKHKYNLVLPFVSLPSRSCSLSQIWKTCSTGINIRETSKSTMKLIT